MITDFSKIYDETCRVQVEQVKLGDVTYHTRCRISTFEGLLSKTEEDLIRYKNDGNDTLVEWAQGKIEAYRLSIEAMKELNRTFENLAR